MPIEAPPFSTLAKGVCGILQMLLFLALSSCAGMETQTIKPATEESYNANTKTWNCGTGDPANPGSTKNRELCDQSSQAAGFRYFEEAPFLFVHSDGKGGVVGEIVWLPDTTKKMSVRPYAFLATNKVSLAFTNGMLTESSVTGDETVIPNAVLSAVVAAGVKSTDAASGESQVPLPYLFKIQIGKDGQVTLTGGFATDKDKVTPLVIHVTIAASGGSP